jgi:hypothetical protein
VDTAGNVTATGNITGANLITTGVVNAGSLVTSGNAIIGGDLVVNGNVTYVNVTDLNIEDPIIGLGRGANNTPLVTDDGKDRGEQLWYFSGTEKSAFTGYQNSSGKILLATNVSIANEIVTVNSFGTVSIGNLEGASISVTGNTTAGNVLSGGVVSATGNITGANVNTAGLITATGNVIAGNISTAGVMTATGNVTGANLVTAGNVSTNNASVTGNIIVGKSLQLANNNGGTAQVFRIEYNAANAAVDFIFV